MHVEVLPVSAIKETFYMCSQAAHFATNALLIVCSYVFIWRVKLSHSGGADAEYNTKLELYLRHVDAVIKAAPQPAGIIVTQFTCSSALPSLLASSELS